MGGYNTSKRCYYPKDYYEQLSRSLVNTKIDYINNSHTYEVVKKVPNYAYGTRGSYAGYVTEIMTFDKQMKISLSSFLPFIFMLHTTKPGNRFYFGCF